MTKNRFTLLYFLTINLCIIVDKSYAIKDGVPFPDNYLFSGKSCESKVNLHADSQGSDGFVALNGDFTKTDSELAFDCTVEVIIPPESALGAVTIECKKIEILKTLGDGSACPLIIEVNKGAKKVCANTEELSGKFAALNKKVEFRIISLPKARNKFKGGQPTFQCRVKLDDDNGAIKYPPETNLDLNNAPGFFTSQNCAEEVNIDKESDVKTIDTPLQLHEGFSYFNCPKTINVPEGYNLVVRCSKFRLIEYDDSDNCVAFTQIDSGQKVCHPERISGIYKPNSGKVKLTLVSNAINGLRYRVGKPLIDCRLTIQRSATINGFIMTTSVSGSYASLYRSQRVEEVIKEKHYDIPKMSKEDYQKAVVSRPTPVEGLSACGGHICLEKWGYTFTLEGEMISSAQTIANFDCSWTFSLPKKKNDRMDSYNALAIRCDKMPINKPSTEKCSAFFMVNNELSYCNDDPQSNLEGFFGFGDSTVLFRVRSAHDNIYQQNKPIFNCTFLAVSVLSNQYVSPPKSIEAIGTQKRNTKTIDVSLDGKRPTYMIGNKMANDGSVSIDDTWILRVPPAKNVNLQTRLVVQCKRFNTVKVGDKVCQSYYLVNEKHKVCEGNELNGLYLPLDNFGTNCAVKLQIKTTTTQLVFAGDNIPYYQCKAFAHDMTPWSDIYRGIRLMSSESIGHFIAGSRKSCDKKCECGLDATIGGESNKEEPISTDSTTELSASVGTTPEITAGSRKKRSSTEDKRLTSGLAEDKHLTSDLTDEKSQTSNKVLADDKSNKALEDNKKSNKSKSDDSDAKLKMNFKMNMKAGGNAGSSRSHSRNNTASGSSGSSEHNSGSSSTGGSDLSQESENNRTNNINQQKTTSGNSDSDSGSSSSSSSSDANTNSNSNSDSNSNSNENNNSNGKSNSNSKSDSSSKSGSKGGLSLSFKFGGSGKSGATGNGNGNGNDNSSTSEENSMSKNRKLKKDGQETGDSSDDSSSSSKYSKTSSGDDSSSSKYSKTSSYKSKSESSSGSDGEDSESSTKRKNTKLGSSGSSSKTSDYSSKSETKKKKSEGNRKGIKSFSSISDEEEETGGVSKSETNNSSKSEDIKPDEPNKSDGNSAGDAKPETDKNMVTIFHRQISILGSYRDIDALPIGKLAQIKLSELADTRYNVKSIEDMKIGQLGALADMGQMAKLGGLTIGQIRSLNVISSLSYEQFGPLGEMEIKHIITINKEGKLGIFEKITFEQLGQLAKTKLLQRLTISLIALVVPVSQKLKKQINDVIANAEFKGQRNLYQNMFKYDRPQYAFQLPQINEVYDLITLNHVLYESMLELSKKNSTKLPNKASFLNSPLQSMSSFGSKFKSKMMGDSSAETKDGNVDNKDNKDEDSSQQNQQNKQMVKTKEELHRNAEYKLTKILEMIKINSNHKTMCEKLEDCNEDQMSNVVRVLLNLVDSLMNGLSGGTKNKLLENLHHIEIWSVNRLLAGLLGGQRMILGTSLEPALESVAKVLGGSLNELKTESPNVKLSNDRALYLIVRLLGKPYENICPRVSSAEQNTSKPERRKRSASSRKVDNDYDYQASNQNSASDDSEDRMVKADNPIEEVPPPPPPKCELVKDNDHFKAVADGKDGGTISIPKHEEITDVLLNFAKPDNKNMSIEVTLFDRKLKWRLSRLLVGFASGILKKFDDSLEPETYKFADTFIKGIDVLLPSSSQSLAMGISGTMDSTLVSVGVSVTGVLSIAQGKTVNETIAPMASLLKIDATTNGITAPILDAITTLINNAGNLGPKLLKKLLDSLITNIKPNFYLIQTLANSLDTNDLKTFTKVFGGLLFAAAKISGTTDQEVSSLIMALNNTLMAGQLDQIAKTMISVGAPMNSAMQSSNIIVHGHVSMVAINFDKLKTKLGSIAPIVIPSDVTAYSGPENNVWKSKKLDELSLSELSQLLVAVSQRLDFLFIDLSNQSFNGKFNMGQIMSLIQTIFGFVVSIIISISHTFVDFIDKGSPVYYSQKMATGINCVSHLSRMLSVVSQDLDLSKNNTIKPFSSIEFNAELNSQFFNQMSYAFSSYSTRTGGMYAEVGFTAIALAYGVGTTINNIANVFYDFGHSVAVTNKHQLIPGTIGAIQEQLGSAPSNNVDSSMGTLDEDSSIKEKVAARRRKLILQHEKSETYLRKHGIVVVATDKGGSHIGQFYDEEDLHTDTKDIIMNQVTNILLQREIQQEMMAADKGKKIEPTTFEIEILISGAKKKINVTLSTLTNDEKDNEEGSGAYPGPPVDEFAVTNDKLNEYTPYGHQTCLQWRESAARKMVSYQEVFIPRCLPDGSYEVEQCDQTAGICWCVNENGQQIVGTMTRLMKPNCDAFRKPSSGTSKQTPKEVNDNPEENEIDIGSKYVIGPSLQEKEKSESNLKTIKDYETSECFREQRHRELLIKRKVCAAVGVFVPECTDDGSYAAVQCDKRTSFCWCVTKSGKEIPNTGQIGEEPKNCAELQQKYSVTKDKQWHFVSWTYLWAITRKWQELTHLKVLSARRSDPNYKHKPNGTLVRLPKSSGFDNSVMFCAKESAGPNLPSPYEVWIQIMYSENPNFNRSQYEIQSKELNRLALIRLPVGNGQTIQVPLVSVIEAFPAAQDLYRKFNGDVDKLEEVLQNMKIDWKVLLAARKSAANNNEELKGRPSGVLADGHMNMVSAQKMCFCYGTPNSGSVVNAGNFGKSSGSGGFGFGAKSSFRMRSQSSSTTNNTSSAGNDDEEKMLRSSADDADKSLTAEQGPTGAAASIMNSVVQTITQTNPIRLLASTDLSPILEIKGINMYKIKAPLDFFSNAFFDQFCAKVGISKADLSKEVGADVSQPEKSDAMISVGTLIKLGVKSTLRVGDYLNFFGVDLSKSMANYDAYMIESVKKPVAVADVFLQKGINEGVNQVTSYVEKQGGPVNAILGAVGYATGTDVGDEASKTIAGIPMKLYSIPSFIEEQVLLAFRAIETAFKMVKVTYEQLIGPNSILYKYINPIFDMTESILGIIKMILSGQWFQAIVDLIGQFIGPTGRAVVYIIFAPVTTMLNMVFGPMLLIPKILLYGNGDIFDRCLAIPPVIIQMAGGLFKPILMIIEPFLRCLRFLVTGEFNPSLSAGLDISAGYGISIYAGAYKNKPNPNSNPTPPPKQRPKRSAEDGNDGIDNELREGEDQSQSDSKSTNPDIQTAEKYQGGPPPGGYRLGVQLDLRADLNTDTIISRILLIPDFLLKAGGSIFIPFASVLAPVLRATHEIVFGTADLFTKVMDIPAMFSGVGFIGPIADILTALLPVIKLARTVYRGELSAIEIVMQGPNLVKQLTGGIVQTLISAPMSIVGSMFSFFDGRGGLLSMAKIQYYGEAPTTGIGAAVEFKVEASFFTDIFGMFFGGWFLQYIEAVGPIMSFVCAMFNGILGNLLDPVKFLDLGVNLALQPLKTIMTIFGDQPKMYKASSDQKMFLIATLGGQDPDPLKEIGFDIGKMASKNIDVAYFLVSGTKLLKPEQKKQFENQDPSNLYELGIDVKLIVKVDLTIKLVLDCGLLDANQDRLRDMGIDTFNIMNRVMRNSVEDKFKLMMAGINLKLMFKAGIDPPWLLSAGVDAIKDDIYRNVGFDKKNLKDESNMKKIGINTVKLSSKSIDPQTFAQKGVEGYSKEVIRNSIGINTEKLMNSMCSGLDPTKTSKAGVDVKKMIAAGIDPKLLLTGGLRAALNGDVSKGSLLRIGIDLDIVLSLGININILLDVGAAVLNPVSLIKMGIDPQRALIGVLSATGLDSLTGGIEGDNATLGFISSIFMLLKKIFSLLTLVRMIPIIGPLLVDSNGKFYGISGLVFYNIIGIDFNRGLLGFVKKVLSGKFTLAELLRLLNPIRLIQTVFGLSVDAGVHLNVKFDANDPRKPVDEDETRKSRSKEEEDGTKLKSDFEDEEEEMTTTKKPQRVRPTQAKSKSNYKKATTKRPQMIGMLFD